MCDCLVNPIPQDWVCLSAGERQAGEWLQKAKDWALTYKIWARDTPFKGAATDYTATASEISFARGSRIIALPANPATSRGYSANLVLDEFAWHEDPARIWAAIYPSISNPLKGLKKLRVISTPNGRGNKFYQLFTGANKFSKSLLTIHDAVAQGLAMDIEELRIGVGDDAIWDQEYLCIFGDNSTVLLPYDMLTRAERNEPVFVPTGTPLYIGVDIGRSKDLTVITTLADVDGILYTVDVEILDNTPFADQYKVINGKITDDVKSVAIDATGIGAGLAESLSDKHGSLIDRVVFTNQSKNEMCLAMRKRFEADKITYPCEQRYRDDLHAMVRKVSSGGTVTYTAARSKDGHSDFATSLMLAIRAHKNTEYGDVIMPFTI